MSHWFPQTLDDRCVTPELLTVGAEAQRHSVLLRYCSFLEARSFENQNLKGGIGRYLFEKEGWQARSVYG